MMIQGDFFQLTPVTEDSMLFDLKLLHEIKGKNPRQEYKEAGYGLTLEHALKKCTQYAISQRYDVMSLKEYLKAFKEIQKEIGLQINVPIK